VRECIQVGTPQYVDPEYMRSGMFSTKSDIYALGMVMLQVLSGQERALVSSVEEAYKKAKSDPSHILEVKQEV